MTNGPAHNLWSFADMLTRRRNLILAVILVVTLAGVMTALLLPKWYRASASLLPPKNVSVPIAGSTLIAEAVSVTSGLDLPVMATPSDVYARMLKSRTITSRIITRFNLKERYKARNYEETYEALMDHAEFRVTEEGLLMVSVEDKDPAVSMEMTNAFIDELDNVNREIVAERIRQTRDFVEERLVRVKTELDSARGALEEFQMKYRAVDFDEQTRLAIEQAANLKVILAEIELNLQMGQLNLGKDNADLIELRRRRDVVRGQLDQLENKNPDSSFFSLPVASIPVLKGKYEVLYSRVRVSEALYQVLLEQLESAKMKEYEKMPTISVLDRAQVPELKSRPKRSLIAGGAFGLSVVLAIFWAALLEYFERLKVRSPEDHARAMRFIAAFFGWLPFVRKKMR